MSAGVRARTRSFAIGFALAASLCLPASAAAEGWQPFKFASPEKVEATQTQVGVDQAGNVTAVWRNDPNITNVFGALTISSAVLPFGAGEYAKPLPINSTAGSGNPRIGVLGNGNAVVAWERNDGGTPSKDIIEGATRAFGSWSGVTELTDPGDETADYPIMDMLPNGEGLLVWRLGGNEKDKVRLIQGGNFQGGVAKTFNTSPTSNNEADVAIAPDASRRFLAAHKEDLGNTRLNLFTYEGSTWDTGTFIANPTSRMQVAVAPNGEPVTAWLESSSVLKIQRGSSEPVTIATLSKPSELDLAVGPKTDEFPNGMVLLTWSQFVQDPEALAGACCDQARAAVGNGVTMSAPIELSDENESIKDSPATQVAAVQAAIGPEGTAYAVWTRFDGGFWIPEASVRPPGGSFPAVADQISGGDAYVTDLVVAADGRAIVGIEHIFDENDQLYFRAGTAIYQPGPAAPKPEPGGTPPASSPPPSPSDTTPPKLKVGVSRNVFAPGAKLNQIAVEDGDPSYVWKKVRTPVKVGTRVLVSLDEPASLTIRVNKVGCLKAKPGNPTRQISGQCLHRDDDVQRLRTNGKAGANKFTYLGDWGGGKVKPGALYEFVVVATDQFGNASKPRRVGFSVDGKQNANGF
jgi:hypothetical protein